VEPVHWEIFSIQAPVQREISADIKTAGVKKYISICMHTNVVWLAGAAEGCDEETYRVAQARKGRSKIRIVSEPQAATVSSWLVARGSYLAEHALKPGIKSVAYNFRATEQSYEHETILVYAYILM
jgi:hypothetical protein